MRAINVAILALFLLSSLILVKAKCPSNLPIEVGESCYQVVLRDLKTAKGARDNCEDMAPNSRLAFLTEKKAVNEIAKIVQEFVEENLKSATIWLGLRTEDRSPMKDAKDRNWKWTYDGEEFVQKEYKLWDTEGGPEDKNLDCAAIDTSNDYLVKAVKCSGRKYPGICLKEKGQKCTHEVSPFLVFQNYCLSPLRAAMERDHVDNACQTGAPTPYTDGMREAIEQASKNLFLGGGMFLNLYRYGDKFYYPDGTEPDPDFWEDGEPRGEYDCAGVVVQNNFELKLKALNCNAYLASLCGIETRNDTISER